MRTVLVPHQIAVPPHDERRHSGAITILHGQTMGATWTTNLVLPDGANAEDIERRILSNLDSVNAQMSTWLPTSDISVFNRAPAGHWQDLPDDFFHVIQTAIDIATDTGGAFDPTVGHLTNAWGFGPITNPFRIPPVEIVNEARSAIGWGRVLLDVVNRRVHQPGGAYLDFSAIAKGFAVDKIAEDLLSQGIRNFLVEIGGELRGEGFKGGDQPWWVAIESPDIESQSLRQSCDFLIALHGLSVATSGDYRRWFEIGGKIIAHTFDPRTGLPLANRLASVSVVAKSCMKADALATALMVLGPADGISYAERNEIAALFVIRDGAQLRPVMSAAMAAMT
ncbi:FAD:protein FMN transferase [Hyphomicrobium sp. 99]|uniref:FAD:protein FMN transferase n=1 Tax=Hyphomicrobium sp. 99 TaxID=1163419 RepID=UPI0005F800B4|nr:FAD:protein FMN transferase [Hyphomicrobium sp. 99]